MKTIPQLEAMLDQMGSDVTYHREEGLTPCPCLTPEGFRDPAWHLLYPPGSPRLDLFTDPESLFNPPWVSLTSAGIMQSTGLKAIIEDFALRTPNMLEGQGGIAMFLFIGSTSVPYPSPDDSVHVTWSFWGSENQGFGVTPQSLWASIAADPSNWALTTPDLQHIGYIGKVKSRDGGDWYVWVSLPGDGFDWVTGAYVQPNLDSGTYPVKNVAGNFNPVTLNAPPICNEEGMIAVTTTQQVVKASIQPATIGQRGRAAERVNELLGEVQRDDHFGIFPVTWGGVTLDFSAFSDSGDDYIIYDNRRFLVVAADKIPDVDGDPNHHWEVGLRLVKLTRPA